MTDDRIKRLNESLNPDSIIKEALEISTNKYEASHGKKPRGDGNWFFTNGDFLLDFHKHEEGKDYVKTRGKFREAAKEAAKKLGVSRVWAQP